MSLIGLFGISRQDSEIRRLSTQLDYAGSQDVRAAARANRVADNVGELNLLMLVSMRALLDKGILTYEDLGRTFAQLDSLDGKADGKITLEDVRNALGLKPPPAAATAPRNPGKSP
jgi:hypothetical protein